MPRLFVIPLLLSLAPLQAQVLLPPPTVQGDAGKNGGPPPLKKPLEQATVFARDATEAMRDENWKKAAEKWGEVLKLQPDSAAALSNLGSVEMRLEKFAEARTHLEKAVSLRPNLAATWMTLAMLHLDQKNPMLAVSCMARAVHEDPADPRMHNSMAVVLKQVGWTNGAEQELQKAIDLNGDYAEAQFNLALLYLEQKPPALESARRFYFRARDLGAEPDDLVDKQFAEAGIVYTPPPITSAADKPGAPADSETQKDTKKPAKPSAESKPKTETKPKAKSKARAKA